MDIEEIIKSKTLIFDNETRIKLEQYVSKLISLKPQTFKEFDAACIKCRRIFKICPKKAHIIAIYRHMIKNGKIELDENMEKLMIKKLCRKASGVEIITVLTSPFPSYTKDGVKKTQKFSCGKNCFYCPNEGMITIHCNILNKIETKEKYTTFRIKSNDDIQEVRVLTYLNFTKDSTNDIPIANSFEYNDETREFTIEIYNKFVEQFEGKTEFWATKIEQTRSYISTEPAVRRANANNFDPVLQFYDRAMSLQYCGHIIDKLEILVLGGTWSHYPIAYQEEFIRDIYYAANTFYEDDKREKYSMEDEIMCNQYSKSRIIGLTLETRPDAINKHEIIRFRKYGCTRVQLGVQHIDDDVLKKINRGCYTKHTKKALYLLKQNCFKIDIHLMPDLYGSTYEKDYDMFNRLLGIENQETINNKLHQYRRIYIYLFVYCLLNYCFLQNFYLPLIPYLILALFWMYFIHRDYHNFVEYHLTEPELQADQWKIYPTEVVRWTKIYDLFHSGEYKPYAEEINEGTGNKKIIDMILHAKKKVYPWIRLNRVIRDIPTTEIYGGNMNTSLRQLLQKKLKDEGNSCKCIRCREVKYRKINPKDVKLMIRKYNDSNADEYFISFESKNEDILYGFCRLRLNNSNDSIFFDELKDSALIRELHVYGLMVPHDSKKKVTQHFGFGKRLLKAAEHIAMDNNFNKISIISGIGVREYYSKNGYFQENTYMVKKLY